MKTRYRLVREDYASGYTQWNVERKFLWWWEFVWGSWDKDKAMQTLEKLLNGTPEKNRTVVFE